MFLQAALNGARTHPAAPRTPPPSVRSEHRHQNLDWFAKKARTLVAVPYMAVATGDCVLEAL